MNSDRNNFFSRQLRLLELTGNDLLTDRFPPQDIHNASARLLRSGVSVSTFALLESYLEIIFEDLINAVSSCRVYYGDLTGSLQKMLTTDAVIGLVTRAQFLAKSEQQTYVEAKLPLLAAFRETPPKYTAFGFSPKGSNVGADDIRDGFSAFGIDKVWNRLRDVARDIGVARLSLEDDFRNLTRARNAAAHNPDSNIPTSDLQANIRNSITIGICCDLLASACKEGYSAARGSIDIDLSSITTIPVYRFLDLGMDGKWSESLPSKKTVKRYVDREVAIATALGRAKTKIVVIRNQSQIPEALAGN